MTSALTARGPGSIAFVHNSYTLVRPLFSWGRVYRVFGPDGSLAAFVRQPWLRLRTELIIHADEDELDPILVIKNRRFAAFNMEHDLFEAKSGARLGVVRNRGLRSIFRDAWDILDADEHVAGEMIEEGPAIWRRIFRFIPGRHRIDLGGHTVAGCTRSFISSGASSCSICCRSTIRSSRASPLPAR
jgi:hypothetical protein